MRFVLAIMVALSALGFTLNAQTASQKVIDLMKAKEYEKASEFIQEAVTKEKNTDGDFLLKCGDVYMEINKPDLALNMYNMAADKDGNKSRIMRKVALATSELKQYDKAINILKKAQKDDKNNIDLDLDLAKVYLQADSMPQAELVITKAREKDKKNPKAFIALGDLYFKRGVHELARQNYEEALKLDEKNVEARKNLAESCYWLGNGENDKDLANEYFSRSLSEWARVTREDSLDSKAWFQAGKICFLAKMYRDAVPFLEKYVTMRPKGTQGRWYLAQSYDLLGNIDSTYYREALKHLPIVATEMDSVKKRANLMMARDLFNLRDYKGAIDQFKLTMKDTVLGNDDYGYFGQCYFSTSDTLSAFKIWEEAADKYPDLNCRRLDNMGYLYNKMALFGDAIRVLKKRLATGKCSGNKDHLAYYFIGNSYLFSQLPDSSIAYFRKAFEIEKTLIMAKVYEGDAYANLKEMEKAVECFNEAIVAGKADSTSNAKFAMNTAYQKICQMYLEEKSFKKLIEKATEWTEAAPTSEYAFFYLAAAYHSSGQGALACKFYRKVLQLNPNNTSAKKNLSSLQASGGCGE